MYQRPQKKQHRYQTQRQEMKAITEIVGMFAVNWPRYDNDTWPHRCANY